MNKTGNQHVYGLTDKDIEEVDRKTAKDMGFLRDYYKFAAGKPDFDMLGAIVWNSRAIAQSVAKGRQSPYKELHPNYYKSDKK